MSEPTRCRHEPNIPYNDLLVSKRKSSSKFCDVCIKAQFLSQRILAKELGIGLGSINFCFQALVEKGLIMMQKLSQSQSKLRYAYLQTPVGIAEKSKLTDEFLKRKNLEYETLKAQIEVLQAENYLLKQSDEEL